MSGDDHVSCVDRATGAVLWRTPTEVPFVSDVEVAGDVAYGMGLRDPRGEDSSPVSYVLALHARTGHPLWRFERAGVAVHLLACTRDAVFVSDWQGVHRIGP